MIDKLGGLKLPPFKYAVSGPSLCPGHLYRVDSCSDEHRAEFFAVTALAAVTDLPAIGWDVSMAPGFSSEVAPENSPVGGLAISRELDRRLRSLEAVHGA